MANGNPRLITQRIRRPDSYDDSSIEKWLEIFYATKGEAESQPTIHLRGKLEDENAVSEKNIEGFLNNKIDKQSFFDNIFTISPCNTEDANPHDYDPFNKDQSGMPELYNVLKIKTSESKNS